MTSFYIIAKLKKLKDIENLKTIKLIVCQLFIVKPCTGNPKQRQGLNAPSPFLPKSLTIALVIVEFQLEKQLCVLYTSYFYYLSFIVCMGANLENSQFAK